MTSYHRVSYQVKPHPYYPGKQLVIQSHFPPPAVTKFVLEEMQPDRTETPDHPLEESIRRPPLPGKDGNQTVEIEIIQEIRTGERHSAQLVLVKVGKCQPPLPDHSPQEGTVVVAKIYDPVYADWTDHDTLYAADSSYMFECNTYTILKHLQGTSIPKFYGSFTLKIPARVGNGTVQERLVRMILIEYSQGRQMDKLDPADFPQSQRQIILKKLLIFQQKYLPLTWNTVIWYHATF